MSETTTLLTSTAEAASLPSNPSPSRSNTGEDNVDVVDSRTIPQPVTSNPENWPRNFRLVPAYRPVNRELDAAERPYGANALEYIFISVMLQGVRMQSGFTKMWEATGGRWWPGLTRWKIGGEW